LATPFQCIQNSSDAAAAQNIAQIVRDEQIGLVVCGVPLNDDGSPNPQSRRTSDFIAVLQKTVGVDILPVNEFLTTFEAENLLAGNFTSGQKKKRLDALAAARILQGYLDSAP
jgi:putative transcription antitermination factor YqgF